MDFSEEVLDIVRHSVAKYPNDVAKATDYAEERIRKLATFQSLVNSMITTSVQTLVYRARQTSNLALRRSAGGVGSTPKFNAAESKSFAEVEASYFNYYIGGRTLGSVLGSELPDIISEEDAQVEAHSANAEICRALAKLVPPDKTVQQTLTDAKLKKIFETVHRRHARRESAS